MIMKDVLSILYSCVFVTTVANKLLSIDDVTTLKMNTQPPTKEVLQVKVGLYIESISGLSDKHMSYKTDLRLRMSWNDSRLIHNNTDGIWIKDSFQMSHIWRPDLYFTNAIEAHLHQVTMPNDVLYIDNDGTISYSVRLGLTASCPMKLHRYPFDSQICHLNISSYRSTINSVSLKWFEHERAIELNPHVELNDFSIDNVTPAYCSRIYQFPISQNRRNRSQFPCLSAALSLSRSHSHHLLQTFLPMLLTVVVSFVGFWIDPTAVPARITISFISLLIVATQGASVRMRVPQCSYAKAIDYFVFMCVWLVFGGLLEFAIVNALLASAGRRKEAAAAKKQEGMEKEAKKDEKMAELLKKYALNLDKLCRLAYPIMLVMFNVIYWTVLLK